VSPGRGRVLTAFSPKGGTGKSVVATSLAAAFASSLGKRTLLVDLDLQFGDAAIMLGIEPERTIYDVVVEQGELDAASLERGTVRHSSGVAVLPAPLRPEDAELVTESKLGALLEVAREAYDVVVVDTSSFFHGPMLATLDRTDDLLLTCTLDAPTVRSVRRSLETLELLSFAGDRIRLVLNRADAKAGMKRADLEEALERKIRFEIPNDRAVPVAVNRGVPAVLADERSGFARAIFQMARALSPAAVEHEAPGLLFGR
jgi:pilus assembly protein CpaE